MNPRTKSVEVPMPVPCDAVDCLKQATKRVNLVTTGADAYLCEDHLESFDKRGLLRKDIDSIMFKGRSIYDLSDEELAKEIHALEVVTSGTHEGESYLVNLQEAMRLRIKRRGDVSCRRNTDKDQ